MTSTATILVVDDESGIRMTLADILTRDGHQVIPAENGKVALDLIASHSFDLALIDLRLGDMEGTEVLAAIRRHSPDTITIMLTAHASLETAIQSLRQGAHDYLFKPCQPVELRESIRQGLLKRQHAIRQRDSLSHLAQQFASNLKDIQMLLVEQAAPPILTPATTPSEEPSPAVSNPPDKEKRFLQKAGLIVDFLRHIVTLDGQMLELSPTEFGLLVYLLRASPRIVSPLELVREVLEYDSEPWQASEIVRVHIYHLRQKFKETSGRTRIIRTIRGMGYAIGE